MFIHAVKYWQVFVNVYDKSCWMLLVVLSFRWCYDYYDYDVIIMSRVYLNTLGGIGGHGITLYKGCNDGDFFI